jgi:hypothetical protein
MVFSFGSPFQGIEHSTSNVLVPEADQSLAETPNVEVETGSAWALGVGCWALKIERRVRQLL